MGSSAPAVSKHAVYLRSLSAPTWKEYWSFNEAICSEAFSSLHAGRPVYLGLEDDVLSSIAARCGFADGSPIHHLAAAVRSTLDLKGHSGGSPFELHRRIALEWEKDPGDLSPPFTALLTLFSLSAEAMRTEGGMAGHNYYGRLEQLLTITDEHEKARLKQGFQADSQAFWRLLNTWLSDWDGTRGYPTARVLDRRVYVSLPLSQVLVRKQDRHHLRLMFGDAGLLPGQRISAAEMSLLVDDWISSRRAGPTLARIWLTNEGRERVVAIACAELEAWKGEESSEKHATRLARLIWLAEQQHRPLPRLNLYLAVSSSLAGAEGRYQLGDTSSAAARVALGAAGAALRLEAMGDRPWLSLEPWDTFSLDDLMLSSIVLKRVDSNPELRREPRGIIPLAYDERDGLFVEVARAQLLDRMLVLCHTSIADRVDAHLRRIASPGFARAGHDTVRGIPESWAMFTDVELIGTAAEIPPDLSALDPIPSNQLTLTGGLLLGHETWHRGAQPDVRAALASGGAFSTVLHYLHSDLAAPPIAVRQHTGANITPVSNSPLDDGDYRLILEHGLDGKQRSVAQAVFRIRSADRPRPSATITPGPLAYPICRPLGLLSATPAAQTSIETGSLSGALLMSEVDGTAGQSRLALPLEPQFVGDAAADLPDRQAGSLAKATASGVACVTRGYHIWRCQPAVGGETRHTLMWQCCSDCGLKVWTRNRGTRTRKARPQPQRNRVQSVTRTPEIARLESTARRSQCWTFNLLLDALSYLRGGTWAQLKNIASHVDERPWFSLFAARVLSMLAHLDIELDTADLRPKAWRIAPPVLTVLADGTAVLCGIRCERLVRSVERAVRALGGQLQVERSDLGLDVVRLCGLDSDALELAAAEADIGTGEQLRLVRGLPERLLSFLAPLESVEHRLPKRRLGSEPAEQFDLRIGRWREGRRVEAPGAYRFAIHGVTYGVVLPAEADQGVIRIADASTVKHIAARHAGACLIGYDPDLRRLIAPLGCELPGLLSRTAAMCSGRPPLQAAGMLMYDSVPAEVASMIGARIYAGAQSRTCRALEDIEADV